MRRGACDLSEKNVLFSLFYCQYGFYGVRPAVNIHKTKQKAAPQFLHGTRTNKASPQYKLPNNFSHIQADFTNWVDTHTTPEHLALLSLQEEVGNLLSIYYSARQ